MDCVLANPLKSSANPWGFGNHTLGTTGVYTSDEQPVDRGPHVVTVVPLLFNCMRSKGLNHSQFRHFLSDMDSENGDVLY
jgi:hypothetical protein